MEIVVNDNFSIATDERNFILRQKITRTSRKGDEYSDWKETYYPSPEMLFNFMIKKSIIASDSKSFKEMYNFLVELQSDIADVVQTEEYRNMLNYIASLRMDKKPETSIEDIAFKKKRGPAKGTGRRGRPPGSKNKRR